MTDPKCPIHGVFHANTTSASCTCPSPLSVSADPPRTAIQNRVREMERLRFEIDNIAKEHIPDFHFLDYQVSTFWTCEKSPIGMCVFKREEIRGQLVPTECRYCGDPVERK